MLTRVERGMRSGTLNVPGIVGMGAASELGAERMTQEASRLTGLRDLLLSLLQELLKDVVVNGSMTHRLPGNLNVSIPGVDGDALMMALRPHVAVSSGSACTSATLEPSYVLRALGLNEELAHASLRFGLGPDNTEEEVRYVAEKVAESVAKQIGESALSNGAQSG